MPTEKKPASHPLEAGEAATGVPAEGSADQGALEPLGRPGLHHWQQANIVDPSLDERGGVFFAAVEMTRMPMILADPRQEDCPIVFANNAFLDLTGYEEGEVLNRNCRFLQGAGTDSAAVTQLREAIRDHRAIALEILNYRRDGTPFWNAVFMGPVFDKTGKLLYFFASQLDVSKRRESEQSLRQAQKMEAIGQLTAGLAHDFNNLLQIINGSLDHLKDKRHDEAAFDRHHTAAVIAAERGAKLTRQLLAFGRRSRMVPKGVDLSELVNSFGELLETSVGQRADLSLNLRRRLPEVLVDPNHLEMALLNVVVNARDASNKGGVITITTKALHLNGDAAARHLEPGDYVMLSVSDEGTGMPPHVLARATEPFFTTKGIGKGTGLGLAMAHGFVQQSGGRLEIESEPGRGTTVRMIFPQIQVERASRDTAKAPIGYQSRPVNQVAPPLILVVDDSQEIAAAAKESLSDIGYRVTVAHDAEEALEHFDQALAAGDPFRLVFSDILMPGGANGLMLAEWVRERDPTVPVLLTTGYNDEMSLDGPRPGSLEVLGKPYRRSELIDRVQAALRHGVRTSPGRTTSDFGPARE
ncbi:ATP-binding protein [Muricoccus nepalensis]|uniref:ATP-binding protein n=1 Tax=Muricoccus nepalensis TaxID=1854500 RepID=UPI001F502D9C|nr:ATP-binding protein [Roseomonas nepalensis]